MPRTMSSSGNLDVDREFDFLFDLLSKKSAVTGGQVIQRIVQPFTPSFQIEIKNVTGDVDFFAEGLEFDDADGFVVSQDGNLGRIDLAANATPADIASAASQGTAGFVFGDHTHKGVHSVAKNGGTQLFGDVTISAGAGVTITPSGNDLAISSSSVPPTGVPVWRTREYYAGIGSNLILDSSWFKHPSA